MRKILEVKKKKSYNLLEFQSYWIFEELKKGLHLFLEKVKFITTFLGMLKQFSIVSK